MHALYLFVFTRERKERNGERWMSQLLMIDSQAVAAHARTIICQHPSMIHSPGNPVEGLRAGPRAEGQAARGF